MSKTLYAKAMRQSTLSRLLRAGAYTAEPTQRSLQWHIFADGNEQAQSAVCVKGDWRFGPDVPYGDTLDGKALYGVARQIAAQHKMTEIGIVIHAGDEFAVSQVKASYSLPENYDAASALILDNPASVIDERPQAASYRFIPCRGGSHSVAARLSGRTDTALSPLIDDEGPITVALTSSALEVIAVLLRAIEAGKLERTEDSGTMLVVVYPRFTALGLVNPKGELITVLSLPHATKGYPVDIGKRIATEMKAHSLEKVTVQIVAANPTVQNAVRQILQDTAGFAVSNFEFKKAVNLHSINGTELHQICEATYGDRVIPEPSVFRPECLAAPGPFGQNFAKTAAASNGSRITKGDALLAIGCKALITTSTIVLLCAAGLGIKSAVDTLRGQAWNLDPAQAQAVADRNQRLTTLDLASAHWNKLTEPRSEAWTVMEFIARVFPEPRNNVSPVILTKATYKLCPMAVDKRQDESPRTIGLIKTCVLEALTIDGRGDDLSKTAVEKALAEATETTRHPLYVAGGSQRLEVSKTADRITPVTINGTPYTTKVTVTIEIAVSPSDPTALPTAAAPIPAANPFDL